MAFALHGLVSPLGTDYLAVATGAHLLADHASCFYCTSAQLHVEEQLLHQPLGSFDAFFGSPVQALITRPLLVATPQVGFVIFVVLSMLSVLIAAVVVWKAFGFGIRGSSGVALVLLAMLSLPAAWNYWEAQWDALLLLPAIVGVALLAANRWPILAGVLLAFLVLKPQTMWLLPVVLVVAQQWRCLAGLLLGTLGLVAGSVILVNPQELAGWLPFVLERGPRVNTSIGIPGLVALVASDRSGFIAAIVAGMLFACVAWAARRKLATQAPLAVALGLSLSALAAPHVFAYDLVLLSVPICVLASRRFERALACAVLLNVGYVGDAFFTHTGVAETVALIILVLCVFQEGRVGSSVEAAVVFGPGAAVATRDRHLVQLASMTAPKTARQNR